MEGAAGGMPWRRARCRTSSRPAWETRLRVGGVGEKEIKTYKFIYLVAELLHGLPGKHACGRERARGEGRRRREGKGTGGTQATGLGTDLSGRDMSVHDENP